MRRASFIAPLVPIVMLVLVAGCGGADKPGSGKEPCVLMNTDLDKLVGQSVDIASSAYQYRCDRRRRPTRQRAIWP